MLCPTPELSELVLLPWDSSELGLVFSLPGTVRGWLFLLMCSYSLCDRQGGCPAEMTCISSDPACGMFHWHRSAISSASAGFVETGPCVSDRQMPSRARRTFADPGYYEIFHHRPLDSGEKKYVMGVLIKTCS